VGKIPTTANWAESLAKERKAIEKVARKRHQEVLEDQKEEGEHLKIQYLLTTVGRALRYAVHVAANDRNRFHEGQSLASLTVESLPELDLPAETAQTVALIDVLWLRPGSPEVVAAFEVEKSTSICSGILRLVDLTRSVGDRAPHLYVVAPDGREREIQAQLHRPAFGDLGGHEVRYILFSDLCEHCAGLCKLGDDHRVLLKIARGRSS
jgi:type II restriction enzyme